MVWTRKVDCDEVVSDFVPPRTSFRRRLSLLFLSTSFAIATSLAFGFGRICQSFVLQKIILNPSIRNLLQVSDTDHDGSSAGASNPGSVYHSYTTRYDSSRFGKGEAVLLSEQAISSDGGFHVIQNFSRGPADGNGDVHVTSLQTPSCEHILVDIANVDNVFLDSEKRLLEAMFSLVRKSDLTPLSYYCQALLPYGKNCVSVLVQGHLSVRTWPTQGLLALDLLSCGPPSLVFLLSDVQELFAVARQAPSGMLDPPRIKWALKQRGFPDSWNPDQTDLAQWIMGQRMFDLKEEVVSVQTTYQEIKIIDIIDPKVLSLDAYQRSLTMNGSYESHHPDLFRPERVIYLDNVLQSRLRGGAAYHESLVHPAIMVHHDPRRVAIIGGGEGATLREVLKYNTVESVTMIEIDEEMVNVCKQYLQAWSDCSSIVGSAPSCFDDPRTNLIYADAVEWFVRIFGPEQDVNDEQRFDVIIMDALDPDAVVEFSDRLYSSNVFIASVSNSLSTSGIVVMQVGEGEHLTDGARESSRGRVLDNTMVHLMDLGFQKIKDYQDGGHGGFMAAWNFLIAFKSLAHNERWYANEAALKLDMAKRLLPTSSSEPPFRFFDGATMQWQSYPSRLQEEAFCRKRITPPYCGSRLDPYKPHAPVDTFEVRSSAVPGAGRGVFARKALVQGTYMAPEESIHAIFVSPATNRVVQSIGTVADRKVFEAYFFGYGFSNAFFGDPAHLVDPGILTFLNHGCNGTYNVGVPGIDLDVTEMTVDPHRMPAGLEDYLVESFQYHPFLERNHMSFLAGRDETLKDIKAGDEILDNYLTMVHSEDWEEDILEYRSMCRNLGGAVEAYEKGRNQSLAY